jgi:L-threonylcarbamoyladenylate synthase
MAAEQFVGVLVRPSLHLRIAVQALQRGELITYPTEGVWGLGCDPDNSEAVSRLLLLKQRPIEKGLILVAANMEQLSPYLCHLSAQQLQVLRSTWPGPNTWLIPANEAVAPWISGGQKNVALRVSVHPVVKALCEAFGGPIVSTSANRSGKSAAISLLAVQLRFPSVVRMPGNLTHPGQPSTIRDLQTGNVIRP